MQVLLFGGLNQFAEDNMPTCFVIQPFDKGTYDKRYRDVFGPAIRDADLDPYRVDQDPASVIPIQDIEEGIRGADVCFAEISEDNPNVWFELGFAIANSKPLVMVSSDRRSRFPFDVQHRTVIEYRTESASDFDSLKLQITERLLEAMKVAEGLKTISRISPTKASEGLSPHEMAALIILGSHAVRSAPSQWQLAREMDRAGYTEIAAALAVRNLLKQGFIEEGHAWDGSNEYTGLFVSDAGFDWLQAHSNDLVLRNEESVPESSDDDLPF